MDWWNRVGAMYQFFNNTPALGYDMATKGPQGDFAYNLAYGLQAADADFDVYPVDTQNAGG